MKVIVCGSRDFQNYDLLKRSLDTILCYYDDIEIVSGAARGADYWGECYAQARGYKLTKLPAMWHIYGRSAGYRRNEQMATYADMVIAFWDGKSKGTAHMIDIARKRGLVVHVIRED